MLAWIVIAAAAVQVVSIERSPILTFSAHPERARVTTQVDVGLLRSRSGVKHYWFRRTVKPDNSHVVETRWADTRSCPAGRVALEELTTLEAPRPYVYGLDGRYDLMLIADGVTYRMETDTAPPFHNGKMKLQSNVGTPLARWVEATTTKLSGCWAKTAPKEET